MEEDSTCSHNEMRLTMSESTSVVNMNPIEGTSHPSQSLELDEERSVQSVQSVAACGINLSDKHSTMQTLPEGTVVTTYSGPVLVQPTLSQSVNICSVEPMDHESSTTTLATIAVSSTSDISQRRSDINQAWFTTKEDKNSLQGKGAKWQQGMWSKEEGDILQSNILEYCKAHGIPDPHDVIFKQSKDERKTFYRTIAKGIHRPLFAIYRRVLRMYESGNYVGKYTSDEVQRLKELRKIHGNDWTAIGLALGRSASSVKDRCRLLKEKCSSGKWTVHEEQCLSSAVRKLTCTKPGESVTTGILWTDVAKIVGTRSEKQCRSKWLNYLNWKECGGKEWNKTDEIDLIKKIYDLGVESENEIDWVTLTNGWVSVRSPQWLRSKWWTIKKHVPEVQGLSFPDTIAYLNSHYARNLRHRLDDHDPRYLQVSTSTEHYPLTNILSTTGTLSPLTTCTALSTSVGHAITVDGEVFMTREDNKGSDGLNGLNGFEMVQLRALPNTDPSQPTSYIIEPVVHCGITGSAHSYILHQTSPSQGIKAMKLATNSGMLRQADSGQVVDNSQVNQDDLPTIVTTETLDVDQTDRANSDEGNELQHDQPLECLSEQEILTTPNTGSPEEFHNTEATCDKDRKNPKSHDQSLRDQSSSPSSSLSSTASQSLEINFPTTDNVIYSPSLVPSVSTSRSEIIIPQPTLPDHILQSQGDEPSFFI